MLFTSSATFVGAFVGVCSQMYACALRKVPLFHRTFLFLIVFVVVVLRRGNESRSFVFSMPLSLRGADDTSRPNTNATPNRTAAPRWIRRRRRVDRGMVGPKRAEFAEGCRRFGRRATGEERRFRLFLFFLGFEIRQVMIYLTNLPRSSSSSFGRRRDGGATIECNCTIPHVLHRILTPRHRCSLRLLSLSLGVVSISNWKYPVLVC